MWRNGGVVWVTFTVCDSDRVDPSNVENCEGDWGGRYGTGTTVGMAKVEHGAEVSQRHLQKVGSCPTLGGV
jgi:hypothetical protein